MDTYRRIFLCSFLAIAIAGCKSPKEDNNEGLLASLQTDKVIGEGNAAIPVVDFEGLKPLLHKEGSTTYVINFWATWCAPCIEELPYFEQLHSDMNDQGVTVILVSIDMPSMWESHLLPFVKKHQLKSGVIVLDDPDQNSWIPQVDETWGGAIPATLIYNENKRQFFESPFEKEELFKTVKTFINTE